MRTFIFLNILFLSAVVHATSGYVSVGYGRGGANLSEQTGGQDYDITAGSGIFMSLGAIFPVSPTIPHRFEAQVGVGYMFQGDGNEQQTDSISWTRFPVDAIYLYRNTRESFRLGYGLTYHFANEIEGKQATATASMGVDDTLGWVVVAEKIFSKRVAVGLRYTDMEYSSSRFSDVNGDSLLITATSLVGEN